MQLKDLAKVSDASQKLLSIFKETPEIKAIDDITRLKDLTSSYSKEVLIASIAQEAFSNEQIRAILQAKGLTEAEIEEIIATKSLSASQAGTTATTLGLGTAFKGLGIKISKATASMKAFLLTNPLGWLTIAATAIGTVALACKKYDEHLEEVRQQIKETAIEAKSAIDGISSNFNELSSKTDNIKLRYANLAQEVKNLGKVSQQRGNLSTEEYEEFLDLSNQLADLFPQLTVGYDENGNAILNLSGNVNTIVGSINDLVDAQKRLANQEIIKNIPDVWSGYMLGLEDLNKELESSENNVEQFLKWANDLKNRSTTTLYSEEANNLLVSAAQQAGIMSSRYGNDFYSEKNIASESGSSFTSSTWDFSKLSDDEYERLLVKLYELGSDYEDAMQLAKGNIVSANSDMANYINTWLSDEYYFNDLTPDMQNAVKNMLFNGSWVDFIPDTVDSENWNAISDWLKKNFLYQINKAQNNSEISKAISEVFTNTEITPDEKANYIKQVQDYFGEGNAVTLLLQPQLEETKVLQNQYQDAISKFGEQNKTELEQFFNDNSINDSSEIDYWNQVTEGAKDATAALNMYNTAKNADNEIGTSTISDSVHQMAQQLRPKFDELASAYSSIFSDDGFNFDVVDNPMLENLRNTFAEIDENIGVTFDTDKINEFFDVLENGTSIAKDSEDAAAIVQDAFNDLATAYFYSTDTLEHLNEETAESIKQQLQQMGIVNSEEIINHYLSLAEAESGLIEIQNQLADAQKDLAESSNTGEYESAKVRIDLIYKQIEAYYNEKGATEELRIALFNLQLQQADLNINSINSSSSVAALLRLAEAAGLSAEYIDRLAFLQDLFNQYNAATNGNMQSAIYSQIQSVKSSLKNDLENSQLDLEFNFPNGKDSGAGAAGKDAAQEYLEGFNNECDRLKFLRDNSIITEKEYLDQLRILYEQYFKDKEEYLEEYVKYEHEYLNGLKSLYENVLGGITDLLDKQMDKIEEERDAKIDALEAEQEARTKALEQQKEQLDLQIEEIESQIKIKDAAIDAINDEIDAIKKANDERQRQLDLQKALYDLERMQNQRTILQYSEDKGMHYVNDTSGIRDAKQAVDDAKTEIEIADKEKQISLIEDEISLLETRKTLIEDQQADLDNQINALDEFYQKLTENTESYYLALIAPMEQYKAQFESIAEIESGAVFDEQLNSLGYSANDILALSSSTLENFKSNYLGILGDIYAGNTQMLDSLSMVSGLNGENLVGYLSQSQPYIDSLARLDLSSTQSAIDSANNGIYSFADGAVLATTNITTMADTTTALLEGDKKHAGIISSFETMASVLTDANNQIAGITSGMEELDGKTATIKINIETNGDTSLLGKAYSSGTAIAGSSHLEGSAFVSGNWAVQSNEQNSLVGEEGFEIIVRNGKFFTVGNNGAELANIQKGDIVFNHEQSKNLLKYGHISGRGKAYADGTVGSGKILTSGGLVLRPLQPGAQMYDLVQKFDAYIKSIDGNLKQLVPGSFYEHNRQMNEMVNHMTNSSVVNNRNIHPVINNEISVTLPNVTNSTSAETLMKDLQSLGTKKFQVNW